MQGPIEEETTKSMTAAQLPELAQWIGTSLVYEIKIKMPRLAAMMKILFKK
jgi:hypothetical protein